MSPLETLNRLQLNISKAIIGKQESIELLLVSLLSGGHVLLEDLPGLGKTMLARSLAKSISARFKRVQCTPDLLPSDVTGISIFNEKTREFEFKPGPVFGNILLVDEINRTTPRTQSSLLEAMAENQVTVDGKTYKLPNPYMVIATQNPIENHGTYPLPEAQLDRFLMRISLGYPSLEDEVQIMQIQKTENPLDKLSEIISIKDIVTLQNIAKRIHITPEILTYIASIIHATRQHKSLSFGASPRGSLALMRVSQAFALIKGQKYVDPQIIKAIAKPVLAHRIALKPQHMAAQTAEGIIDEILASIEVPIVKQDVQKGATPPSQASVQAKKEEPSSAELQPKPKVETTDTGMELFSETVD